MNKIKQESSMQNKSGPIKIEYSSFSFIDLLLLITKKKIQLLKIVAGFLTLGLLIIIFSTKEYTSSATVIPDIEGDTNLGLNRINTLSKTFGLDIGNNIESITADIYPDIIASREVLYAVVSDTLYMDPTLPEFTLIEYLMKKQGFFSKLTNRLKNIIKRADDSGSYIDRDELGKLIKYSQQEMMAMKTLTEDMLEVDLDPNTRKLQIYLTADNPELAAKILSKLIDHFIIRVNDLYTQKSKRNYSFILERHNQSKSDLFEAENELTLFLTKNSEPKTANLKMELARLEREMEFKSQVFNGIQLELSKAEIELEKSKPIITVLEKPDIPNKKSSPKSILLLLSLTIFGLLTGFFWILFINFIQVTEANDLSIRKKLEEIKRNIFVFRQIS